MLRVKDIDHYSFYLLGLIILVIGLPWSPFLISLAQAIILTNWILEGNFTEKFKLLIRRKGALLFLSIFILHLLGVLYSSDIQMAFKDIKIKLPMFIFPVVIATTKPITINQLKRILVFFISTVFISSIISIVALLGLTNHDIIDIRSISLFISHIRFALLINICIFSTGYLILISDKKKRIVAIIYWLLLTWFISFLFILQSLTGIVVFIITSGFLLIRWSVLNSKKYYKISGLIFSVLLPVILITYILYVINKYYSVDEVNINQLEQFTKLGNKYSHNTDSRQIENGHYVWLYICYPELETEWNKRGSIKYNQEDKKGQQIKFTLIRFLTSKGLRKDAKGVAKLTDVEIDYIEKGFANHIYINTFGIYPRIYQIIWEIDQYLQGKNPSGHSVTQRFEYYKSAFNILERNFAFGVGTGDVKSSYDNYYNDSNSKLDTKWRLRAHNQYITFIVTFGLIGFAWIIMSIVISIIKEQGFKNYLFIFFFFIAFLSMINEDTLETQAGATFFAYFYSLFLFGFKTKTQKNLFDEQENIEGAI